MSHARVAVFGSALLTACATCASRPAPAESPAHGESPAALAARLAKPQERNRAACRLFELGLKRTEDAYIPERCTTIPGAVNHVVIAPQASEDPFYLVFHRWPFEDERFGPDKPKGPFSIVDSQGRFSRVFANANMLEEEDDLFAYAGTDAMAVAHVIPYGGGDGARAWTTEVLHVVPVDERQEPALSVVLGPSTYRSEDVCLSSYWTWRRQDIDGDGVPEIEIGPRQNAPAGLLPKAVYRWSAQRRTYEGPEGSVEEGFLRLRPENECRAVRPLRVREIRQGHGRLCRTLALAALAARSDRRPKEDLPRHRHHSLLTGPPLGNTSRTG